MQKHWRHFVKRMQRLMENVRGGSVVDIALLVSGVALVGALVTMFVVQMLPESDGPDKNEAVASVSVASSSASSAVQSPSSNALSGSGAVNPFPAGDGASSSSVKAASSSKKPAASSSKKPAASSSKKPAASSSAPPAPSSSAPPAPPTPPPTPPPAAHVHTYGAWTRECKACESGTEIHVCTGCNGFEQRAVTPIAAHQWTTPVRIPNADSSDTTIYQSKTCTVCGWELTEIVSAPPVPPASSGKGA